MIDPTDSLAFSMHANKGVYAVLLGSGVSRAAKIPTGWEITLELVRKVAALECADCGTDPAAWFMNSKGKAPDYSELLDTLAKTPTERQQLLRPYWEPAVEEREEGAKLPTKAHRAVADLVKLGYVRVIITTNFDRLLETALQDVGVQPTVLSTPDHIEGALPLIHTPCTIIKIHGDYLDTRILNTPEELADYPTAFKQLLDRVFDEFGLIISGWSADWDEALRAALTRAPYRRFSTYWACRGTPSTKAADLIARKGATLIKIEDADTFFSSIAEKVKALDEFSRPHPISTQAAITSLKRYLSEPKYRISLDDLISQQASNVQTAILKAAPDLNLRDINGQTVEHRLKFYESAMETLLQMAFVAGQWSSPDQLAPWLRVLVQFCQRERGGVSVWVDLQRYPATLLLYSFGLGAVQAGRYDSLAKFLEVQVRAPYEDTKRAVELLTVFSLLEQPDTMKRIPGKQDRYTPLNDRIQELLEEKFSRNFPSNEELVLAFDEFEILSGLTSAKNLVESTRRYWVPLGPYGWRTSNRRHILQTIRDSIALDAEASAYVATGLAGNSPKQSLANIDAFEEFVGQLHWGL